MIVGKRGLRENFEGEKGMEGKQGGRLGKGIF